MKDDLSSVENGASGQLGKHTLAAGQTAQTAQRGIHDGKEGFPAIAADELVVDVSG